MPEYPEIKNEETAAEQSIQPNPFLPGYKPHIPEKKEHKPLNKIEKIFIAVFFVLSFILVDFALFHGFHLGFTVAYVLLFAGATVFLWNKEKRPSVFALLCGIISLAGSVTFALYCNTLVNAFMLILVAGLFTIYCLGISSGFNHENGGFRLLIDVFLGAAIEPFGNISDAAGALKATLKTERRNTSVLKGILLSLPVLIIIIPLLISGDAAFEGLISSLGENIGIYLLEIALSVPVFIFGYSFMYGKRNGLNKKSAKAFEMNGKTISVSSCVSFLSVISATYLVYLFSQLAYFFSAFNGILPEGYTRGTSMFARRGFYEMFAVCVINVVIVSVISLLVKKNEKGKNPIPVKILSLFVSLFSVLLIVVAMVKMKLNIETYGFTRNRLLVSVFMIMMLIIIAFFIAHIFMPKIRYMQPIIIICSVMFVVLSFANIDNITYTYNAKAHLNGTIEEFDVYNINDYEPAEEYLVKAIKDGVLAPASKDMLAEDVYYSDEYEVDVTKCRVTAVKSDIRSFCLEKEKSKKIVTEYFSSLTPGDKLWFEQLFANVVYDGEDETFSGEEYDW